MKLYGTKLVFIDLVDYVGVLTQDFIHFYVIAVTHPEVMPVRLMHVRIHFLVQ